MSATNATTNYSFPLFIGTDKPAWLVDWNSAMSAIDAAIKGVDTDVQGAIVDISGLSSTVTSHTSSISTITGQITTITTNLNTATGNINTINSLIGNGTPTTTDQTIIGAINELHANQGNLADLTTPAVSLVAAINALSGGGGAVAASAVSYDNTTSGLTATNVQAAIDEIAQGGSAGLISNADLAAFVSVGSTIAQNSSYNAPADGYYFILISTPDSTHSATLYADSARTHIIGSCDSTNGITVMYPLKQGATIYTRATYGVYTVNGYIPA